MKKYFYFWLLLFSSLAAKSQISLSFPVERQIFQRNNSNQAFVQIAGNFSVEFDSIMARVTPRVAGQGTATNWETIDYRDGKPYFYGKLTAQGGWYTLEVRAHKNGSIIGTANRQRVGVGEVFVIAGQSNATGTTNDTFNQTGLESSDDRSNIMHWANTTNELGKLPFGFSQMSKPNVLGDTTYIGPFQIAPWCWGKTSEVLANVLNVPILFLGAGFGGTHIAWWAQSINGDPFSPPAPFWVRPEYGHPYGALRSVMQYYLSLTGMRAVLWHQGESDKGTISPNAYQNYLEQVIDQTRLESEEPNLAWMVARASWAGGADINVIMGQQQTINADANVFNGPRTDGFIGINMRSDNIHMDKMEGLNAHADSWVNYIAGDSSNSFLATSQPILAKDLLEINSSCNSSSTVTLSTNGYYSQYSWSNRNNTDSEALGEVSDSKGDPHYVLPAGSYHRLNWTYSTANSITVGSGTYALRVRKATSGKMLFSPILEIGTIILPTTPSFTTSAAQVRPGDAVTLIGSNCNGNYIWDTGKPGMVYTLNPAATASYTVKCTTLECMGKTPSSSKQVIVSSCFGTPLNLTGTVANTQIPYQSQQNLKSTQTITSPGKINYTADEYIELKPGFRANSGTVFKATIEDCP